MVLALHAAGIWALQNSMNRPPEPQIIAAEVIAQFIAPPAPEPPAAAPPAPAQPEPPKPTPKPQPPKPKPTPVQKAPPLPKAITDPTPAPNAPKGTLDSAPAPVADAAPPAPPAAPAPPAPPSGGAVQLPSSNAAYLNNPRPSYPSISRRMSEQGKVLLRVLVDENGSPQQIEIKQSSGFDRLDKAALASVQKWRFVPGKRNGVPEAMWNIVPVNFVLE
ncbi:transport protein TonB [compost metagenome]